MTVEALGAREAEGLLAPLRRFTTVILAVSGGPDSLALLMLAHEWAKPLQRAPRLVAVTVDHGLRARARAEAEAVGSLCSKLDVPHRILSWTGEKPSHGLAQAARTARYDLLASLARDYEAEGPVAVVTAHHLDDQAETFLMRLARGAGIDGLAAMRQERPLGHGSHAVLVRPLLSVSKARLMATLQARSLDWFEDPGNFNESSERVRMRALSGELAARGIGADAIGRSARRLQGARAATDYALVFMKTETGLLVHPGFYAQWSRTAFDTAPAFLRERFLAELIAAFSGASPAAQLSEIERAVEQMARPKRACRMTLGGAIVSAGPSRIRVTREPGRIAGAQVSLAPGERWIWDNRFWISASPNLDHAVDVVPLVTAGEWGPPAAPAPASERMTLHLPAAAILALPAIVKNGEVAAVPSLSFYRDGTGLVSASGELLISALPVTAS